MKVRLPALDREALERIAAGGRTKPQKAIRANRRGIMPQWPGRPARPSYSVARCGWRGRTRNLREHKGHKPGTCEAPTYE